MSKFFSLLETILTGASFACFMVSITIIVLSIEDILIIDFKYLPIIGFAGGCSFAIAIMALFSHRLDKIEETIQKLTKKD